MKKLTKSEKVWIACLLDTEGSIVVTVEGYPKKDRYFSVGVRPSLSVGMKDIQMLKRLKKLTGGKIRIYEKFPWGTYHDWRLRGFKNVIPVLSQVSDELILKREKAKVVLRLNKLHLKLLRKPLKQIRLDRKQFHRKRLTDKDTKYLLKFLIKYWFPRFDSGPKSFRVAKKLISELDK